MCCSLTYLTQFSCPPKANTASRMATKISGILSRVTGATRCVLASSLRASVVHSWTALTTRAHTIAAVPRIDAVDMSCTFLTFTSSTPVHRCGAFVLLYSRTAPGWPPCMRFKEPPGSKACARGYVSGQSNLLQHDIWSQVKQIKSS
jgi:hypothetical protein